MLAQNASQASSTPERSNTEDRKRKRDVLSCLDCRRRKLKCDRGFPACSRCVKGGVAALCTYNSFHGATDGQQDELDASADEDARPQKKARGHLGMRLNELAREVGPPGNFMHSASALSAQSNVIKSLESRLATLEKVLSQTSTSEIFRPEGAHAVTTPIPKSEPHRADKAETHLFKGRGLRTQFYGPSNATSLLAHFPEVRVFMKEAHTNSSLQRLQNECNTADARLKGSVAKAPPIPSTDLIGMVPERAVAEPLVRLYFDTFEATYRILHRPTFWKDYESFWRSPGQGGPPGFLPVLLLVMATVRCMSRNEPLSFNHEGSSVRAEAVQWIRACDLWLKQQSQKHRTMAMYQVMCLRLLAASANSLKTKQAYGEAESLLTYFRAAGMHRDPRLLDDRCSPYEMEMRRRLWATTMELELQASIDRGMPSSLGAILADCPTPLNIDDKLFTESSMELPPSRPPDEYTETSFLDTSSKSLSLRIHLCSLINDPSSPMQYDDVLRYEQHINEALDSIPKWEDRETTQASTLLDLQLRQFFLLIHTPFARKTKSSQSRYSRMVCFETAKHILHQHFKLISSNNFAISLIRDDIYRAALTMCHNAFLCSLNPKDMFFQGILINISLTLDEAFKVLEEKCMRRGEGFQYYWHVSAAWGIVEWKLGRENFEAVKVQSTDRISKLYHKVLAFQERPRKPPEIPPSATLSRVGGGINTSASWNYSANVLGVYEFRRNSASAAFTNNEIAGPFDYSDAFDYSDWTLDNLWPLDGQHGEDD